MLTEDYCSYDVAKLLKERGFSENTICKYADIGGITERWYDDYRERVVRFHFDEGYQIEPLIEPKDRYEIIGNTIPAPTHQMAMKWLREKDIDIVIIPLFKFKGGRIYLYEVHSETADLRTGQFDTYEEAVEAALKYCLTYLI